MSLPLYQLIKKAVTDVLVTKIAKKSKSFLEKDYPEKAKKIYRALKREHGESMPAELKARIALSAAKGKNKKKK